MSKNILFPNEEVFDNELFNIHQDWEIPIPAFFILSTKRKIRSFAEFTDEESIEFTKLVRKIRKAMNEVLNIKDVYFFQNEDSTHGFHLWIFPRYNWMEQFGRKIQSVRPIMNYAEENLVNEKMIEEVKSSVQKIKKYMNK